MEEQKQESPKRDEFTLIRIMATDIPTNKNVYTGLTLIKGISWGISNAICKKLKIDKNKKIGELETEERKKIEEFIKNPELPEFLLNRRKDLESGKTGHLTTSDLSLRKEFDIKRLKKIRTYRGLRHALGHPVRGQRTRSHFRKKGKTIGVRVKPGGKK
jgi:small subunit ribosomal protein S13